MLNVIGEPLDLFFQYTASNTGKTALVLANTLVYIKQVPAGGVIATIKNGVAMTTEIGGGIYHYRLPAADYSSKGEFIGWAVTADATVDMKMVPALRIVRGSADLSGDGTTIDCTLLGLRTELRIQLHDLRDDGTADGNYTNTDLNCFINRAYFDTMVVTKCHKETKSIALVAATHTYEAQEIFEVLEVALGTNILEFKRMGDMGVSLERWNTIPAGTPDEWLQLYGSFFRVKPTPDAAAAKAITGLTTAPVAGGTGYVVGDVLTISGGTGGTCEVTAITAGTGAVTAVRLLTSGTDYEVETKGTTGGTGNADCTVAVSAIGNLTVHGYGVADRMVNDTDEPDGVPHVLGCGAILDKAEERARRARPEVGNNLSMADQLNTRWSARCAEIVNAIKGGA